MKNIIRNILIIIILVLLFIKRPYVIKSIINGINLWQNCILPSIFPIMLISDFILNTNLINIISNTIGPIFSKIFRINKCSSYAILMSIISGCPTNAKYIKDLLNMHIIDNNEAIKILSMSLFYNPLLILTITNFLEFYDQVYLIICNLISNLIIGVFNRNIKCNITNNILVSKEFNLVNSISNAIDVLLLILGAIITFAALNSLLPINHPILSGSLEITNGINSINNLDIIYKYKLIFTGILMGFGGFSILTQIKSIFKDTKLDYSIYYKSRIIHITLMITFCYLKII